MLHPYATGDAQDDPNTTDHAGYFASSFPVSSLPTHVPRQTLDGRTLAADIAATNPLAAPPSAPPKVPLSVPQRAMPTPPPLLGPASRPFPAREYMQLAQHRTSHGMGYGQLARTTRPIPRPHTHPVLRAPNTRPAAFFYQGTPPLAPGWPERATSAHELASIARLTPPLGSGAPMMARWPRDKRAHDGHPRGLAWAILPLGLFAAALVVLVVFVAALAVVR